MQIAFQPAPRLRSKLVTRTSIRLVHFPPTLVLVEDDPEVAWALTAQVEDLGYRVVGLARSGEEAIDLIPRMRPSVVLMDIKLEGVVSGLDAARAIRRRSMVPIVFCSVFADLASLPAEVAALGNASLIGKPATDARLRRSLADAVERSG